LTIGIVISLHLTWLDLVCHLPPHHPTTATAVVAAPWRDHIPCSLFFHDSAFNWVLAVCSLDGRTHKILCPLVLPSVFNWTVTGFVQRTKTNGSGPGQFRDVVRPRRVNLKARNRKSCVYTCVVRVHKKEKNNAERIIVGHLFVSFFYEFERDTIYHWHLLLHMVTATWCRDTAADTYVSIPTWNSYKNCHNTHNRYVVVIILQLHEINIFHIFY